MPKIKKIILKEEQISKRVEELAEKISRDFSGKNLFAICVLEGAKFFFSKLAQKITIPFEIGYVRVSSYQNGTESGTIRMLQDLDADIKGKDVLIIDDIIDTGISLDYLKKILEIRNPSSLRICTLLNKPERRLKEVKVDYIGFDIPNQFVVGCGLDFREWGRSFPSIATIGEE